MKFLSFAAYSCPYCARIPLARKKIRKHICRHFKDYFASLALKSGKFLVCKDCLVKSLGNAEARPFVTGVVLNIFFFQSCPACLCAKVGPCPLLVWWYYGSALLAVPFPVNTWREGKVIMMCDNFLFETRLDWLVTGSEIGFARHMGLAHNRLDDTIIKCGDGGFWPRLVVILKKKINFDDLTLEETWESTSALHTKVAFGKVIANRMFRSVGFCPQSLEPKLRWLFNFRFRQTREGLHPLIWQFTWRELTKNRQKRKNKNIIAWPHWTKFCERQSRAG